MSKKNKTTAGLLALFLGSLGAHKFYLGKTKMGIIYLVLCLTGISALISLYEGVQYQRMSDEEFDGKYNPMYAQNNAQEFSDNNQTQSDFQNVSGDAEQNFSDDEGEQISSDNSTGTQDLARTLKDVNKIIKGVQKLANKFNNDNATQDDYTENEYYNEDEYNDDENNR